MRLLLDTHLLLWALTASRRLPREAMTLIAQSTVLISAASIWEISIKATLGKLSVDPARVVAAVEPTGFGWLPILPEHAAAIRRLPMHHRDPFDRMLIAQAQMEGLTLLSNDRALAAYKRGIQIV